MKQFVDKELPELLDLLYEAALDPERWPAFFELMSKRFADAKGLLQFYDRMLGANSANLNFGTQPEFLKSFAEHYANANPYPTLAYGALPVGVVVRASRVVDEPTLATTEFYNDWMRPQAISPHHLGVVLQKNRRTMVLLGIAPDAVALRRAPDTYRKKLQLLTPHLSRAVEMNRVAARAGFAERALAVALDALPAAALMIDGSGRIFVANRLAEALMRDERVIRTDRCGTLMACRPQDSRALAAAIAAGMARLVPPCQPVTLMSTATGRRFLAWIGPSRRANDAAARQSCGGMRTVDRSDMVLVVVTSASKGMTVPAEAIASAFHLTAAEARLASALVAGRTLGEYAVAAGVSRNTARNQLADVFVRMGISRQTELVAKVVGTLGLAREANDD